MESVERSTASAWRRGLRSAIISSAQGVNTEGEWEHLTYSTARVLLSAYKTGRSAYFRDEYTPDQIPFFDTARRMADKARQASEKRIDLLRRSYDDELTAILFLLFFDGDDRAYQRVARGIPAVVARNAQVAGIPRSTAREAQEIVSNSPEIIEAMRTFPRRSLLAAQDDARRSMNLGIASSAMDDGSVVTATTSKMTERSEFPLWEIREVMDYVTRGNPTGRYRDDGFHWQVNGYISTMQEIVRQGCVPPCGVNCRASLAPVSWSRAERLGLVNQAGIVDFPAIRSYNESRQTYIDMGLYPDAGYR